MFYESRLSVFLIWSTLLFSCATEDHTQTRGHSSGDEQGVKTRDLSEPQDSGSTLQNKDDAERPLDEGEGILGYLVDPDLVAATRSESGVWHFSGDKGSVTLSNGATDLLDVLVSAVLLESGETVGESTINADGSFEIETHHKGEGTISLVIEPPNEGNNSSAIAIDLSAEIQEQTRIHHEKFPRIAAILPYPTYLTAHQLAADIMKTMMAKSYDSKLDLNDDGEVSLADNINSLYRYMNEHPQINDNKASRKMLVLFATEIMADVGSNYSELDGTITLEEIQSADKVMELSITQDPIQAKLMGLDFTGDGVYDESDLEYYRETLATLLSL